MATWTRWVAVVIVGLPLSTGCVSEPVGTVELDAGSVEPAPQPALLFNGEISTLRGGDLQLKQPVAVTNAGVDHVDSGVPVEDAGVPVEDAGVAAEDAGVPAEDAGVPAEDAGVAVEDAGVGVEDAGVGVEDAGVPVEDAGLPIEDAGAILVDAGVPLDAGVGVDAGVPLVDGGIDAGLLIASSALVYSPDRTQSPIDAALAQHLRAIAARGTGRPSVFIKVGDSISASQSGGLNGGWFLHCMDGALEGTTPWDINVQLGNHAALAPTISYFKTPSIGVDDSWTRASLATMPGMTAEWAIRGSPSPLSQELAAAHPRYAVVMYGSNDIGWGGGAPYPLADRAETFEWNMRQLTDQLLAQGVVPLLTTMPPDGDFFPYVPAFTAVVRGIAQGRQVPLIDFNRELMALGYPYGLGDDHVHPTCVDWNACCWFDAASLSSHGYNVRNLITLQALDRMRQVFDTGVAALDVQAPHQLGDGSANAPFVIPQLPWGELRDLRDSTSSALGALGCPGAPPVAGPRNLYRLVLTGTTSLRVLLLDGGVGAQQLSLLSNQTPSSCIQTASRLITATLPAGTYYLSVDALTAGGGGEYNLSVSQCVPGDPGC